MREFAYIVETEHGIWVEPLITDSCIGCSNSSCAKRGKAFIVSNPQNIPVQNGDIVRITASARNQAIQAVAALFFPLCAAVGGYQIAGIIAAHIGIAVHDGIQAAGVLIGLFSASAIVYWLNRTKLNFSKPEIAEIIKKRARQ